MREIDDYNVIATGPGHGIVSSSGRLIVPIWMVTKDADEELESHHPGTVATLYSDDHGKTWHLGNRIPHGNVIDPNESSIIELSDGTFLMNIRNQVDYGHEYTKDLDGSINQDEVEEWNKKKYRAISISATGISDWSEMVYDYNLPDPICYGALCQYDNEDILFVNCGSQNAREMLTIRESKDNCKTWINGTTITEKGGYADITVNGNIIFCLAEHPHNDGNNYFSIMLYKFNHAWIEQ